MTLSKRSNPSCALLILSYNGKAHLDACLSTALDAAGSLGSACPVILVDNRSTEDDVDYVHRKFPEVQVIIAKKNDYLFSLNEVVEQRPEEVVIILNNDMKFDRGFIAPLLRYFEDPDVFAVTAKVLDWDGSRTTTGKRTGRFRHFWFYKKWDHEVKSACFTLDAGGGCAAFRRKMFLALKGFDPLYRPGYYEDTDISYRAWKNGWKVIYEPESVIYHKIGATFNKGGTENVTRLIMRNHVLFTAKNCGGMLFLAGYLLLLPWRAVHNYLKGNKPLFYGILEAFQKLPLALSQRFSSRHTAVSDKQLLATIESGQRPVKKI